MKQHIAQVKLSSQEWIQYSSWFWIRNFGPKDYSYNEGVLTLGNDQVISEFFNHHPNLPFEMVSHPTLG